MFIAKEKRKQNSIEYVLYMYQVEDTIRACNFNMDLIEERVISQFRVGESSRQEIRDWYSDLMVLMYQEGVKESGHVSLLTSLTSRMNDLHHKLLHVKQDVRYLELYSWALPNIKAFENKLGKSSTNEVETCLTALYALLLLRLQKKRSRLKHARPCRPSVTCWPCWRSGFGILRRGKQRLSSAWFSLINTSFF
jgi:hypothetical protein